MGIHSAQLAATFSWNGESRWQPYTPRESCDYPVDVKVICEVGQAQRHWGGTVTAQRDFSPSFPSELMAQAKMGLRLRFGTVSARVTPTQCSSRRAFDFEAGYGSMDPLKFAWEFDLRDDTRHDDPDLRADRKLLGDSEPIHALAHLFDLGDATDLTFQARLTTEQIHVMALFQLMPSLENAGITGLYGRGLDSVESLVRAFRTFGCERQASCLEKAIELTPRSMWTEGLDGISDELFQEIDALNSEIYDENYERVEERMAEYIEFNRDAFYLP